MLPELTKQRAKPKRGAKCRKPQGIWEWALSKSNGYSFLTLSPDETPVKRLGWWWWQAFQQQQQCVADLEEERLWLRRESYLNGLPRGENSCDWWETDLSDSIGRLSADYSGGVRLSCHAWANAKLRFLGGLKSRPGNSICVCGSKDNGFIHPQTLIIS